MSDHSVVFINSVDLGREFQFVRTCAVYERKRMFRRTVVYAFPTEHGRATHLKAEAEALAKR